MGNTDILLDKYQSAIVSVVIKIITINYFNYMMMILIIKLDNLLSLLFGFTSSVFTASILSFSFSSIAMFGDLQLHVSV